MKKTSKAALIIILAAVTAVVCIMAAFLLKGRNSYRTVMSVESSTDDRFSMKYQKFSGTKSYTAKLRKGDVLDVNIETEEGALDLAIAEKNNEEHYLYTGKDLPTTTFTVTCGEDGTYVVRFTGHKHKGRYEVSINKADMKSNS